MTTEELIQSLKDSTKSFYENFIAQQYSLQDQICMVAGVLSGGDGLNSFLTQTLSEKNELITKLDAIQNNDIVENFVHGTDSEMIDYVTTALSLDFDSQKYAMIEALNKIS